jgi:hypothetical protein
VSSLVDCEPSKGGLLPSFILFDFFFLGDTEDLVRGLALARSADCHSSHTSSPFILF